MNLKFVNSKGDVVLTETEHGLTSTDAKVAEKIKPVAGNVTLTTTEDKKDA